MNVCFFIVECRSLISDLVCGPPRSIVDMRVYLSTKANISDLNKRISTCLEEMSGFHKLILVAIAVSIEENAVFSLQEASAYVNTYCSALNMEHINRIQLEAAIEYFLQSGLVEKVTNFTSVKLGKGSRTSTLDRVSFFFLLSLLISINFIGIS